MIENIIGKLRRRTRYGFYRTSGGAEIDLVIDFGAGEIWTIEIKRSTAPAVSKGFHSACEDLNPTRKFVVHAGNDNFPLGKNIEAVSMIGILEKLT